MTAINDSHFTKNKNTKLCSELRNLPIVSIEEGQEIGVLNSFLVDPAKKRIVGFILSSHDTKSGGLKVVPFEAITSFGSFALTISRATSVSEVAANPYFIELFEKDIMLLGAEVRSVDGALLGFVKDISMDHTVGALISMKITSDAGFLSPYYASLPFTAVQKLEAYQIVISPEYSVEFKKDTPFSEDNDKIYVPLVAQELQVKQLITERLRSEIDRFRGELRERLFEQHEEYFLKRQKPVLEKALGDSLREWLQNQIAEAMTQSERDMTGHIAAAIEAFFESNHLKKLHEHINSNREDIENLLHADSIKRAELTSQAADLYNQRLAETETRIANNASAALQNMAERLNALITEHKLETDSKSAKTAAAAAENAEIAAGRIREETAQLISEIESKFAALENTTEKHSYEYRSALETLGSEIKSEYRARKQDFETRATAAIDKISNEVESIADRFESEKNSSESLYSELRAFISDTREHFHAELDARIAELSHSQSAAFKRDLNTSIASAADRYNSQLSERIAALSTELRKNLDSISDNLASSLSNATDKIDSFSEELNESAARNSKEIDSFSAVARSAIHAAEAAAKENAALASDFERISETLASFNDQIIALSRNTAEALQQIEDKIQESESKTLEEANNNTADFIEKVFENKLSSLPALADLDNLKTTISDEISALHTNISETTQTNISDSRKETEALLLEKLTTFVIEKTSLQPFEEELQTLEKSIRSEITAVRDEIKNISQATAPSSGSKKNIIPIVEKILEEKMSAFAAEAAAKTSGPDKIAEAIAAEVEKIRTELAQTIQHAADPAAPPPPDTEHILDTIEKWQQALDARLTPLEDNWDTADQSLSDIQRAAEHQSGRLDYVDESIIQTNNSIDALNNILRGTESRVARLRDEVFSLGEILKTNSAAPQAAQTPQSTEARCATSDTGADRVSQLENKIAALEKTLSETRESITNTPASADSSAAGTLDSEQFDFLERNIAELAEKLHALEKKANAASSGSPPASTPPADSLELDSQKQKLKAIEQKVSSFELILPAVTSFFKDSGIRESVNIIRNAQEKSDKLLPALEQKLNRLETALNDIDTSIKEQAAAPHSNSAAGMSEATHETSTPPPAEFGELKTQLATFTEDIASKLADLSASIETSENESREHAVRLVESMQQQIDIALEDITARIETEMAQAAALETETPPPQPAIDQSTLDTLADEQKKLRADLEALANLKQTVLPVQSSAVQSPAQTSEQSQDEAAPTGDQPATSGLLQRAAELEEQFQNLIDLGHKAKNLVTRDEAMQLQDEVVQDAIIQIDARFAGVATQSDIERLTETFRKQIKEKVDSMRDLVFDALEGKIEEVKSLIDADRIEHTIDDILRKKIDPGKHTGG